jgi:diacylglycerol O-acyltransferase
MEQLGGLDAAFLYCETPGMHMHVCGLLVLDPSTMDGDPYDRIRTMLLEALPKVSLMRKRLATVPLGIGRPFWVDDVDFDIDRHLCRVHLGPPGDNRSLAHVVGDVAGRPLRRDRPLWEVWFIEGLAEGRVALLAKMHHSTIDGIEGVSMMGKLFDFGVPAPAGSGQGDDWEPQRLPGQLELLRRGVLGRLADPLEVARLLPATIARLGATLWHLGTRRGRGQDTVKPFTAPRTSINATLTPLRSIAFTDVSLADVKVVKEAFGVKVNDVVAAVVGGGLRRYLVDRGELPNRPLVAAEPVSVHGRTGNVKGVTKLSVIFSTLATNVEDPVERLRAVAAANVRAKEISGAMGSDTFTRWAGQAWPNALSLAARLYSGLRVAEHHPVVYNLLFSNVAGPPFELYLAGARVAGTYAFGPITDGAGLSVTVISTGDRIGFGIVACPDLMPGVWDLAEAMPGALDELTVAVTRLPSGTSRQARRPRTA